MTLSASLLLCCVFSANCRSNPEASNKLALTKVATNNLGGLGPSKGARELRYAHVTTTSDGTKVDLVITNASFYDFNRVGSTNGLNKVRRRLSHKSKHAKDVAEGNIGMIGVRPKDHVDLIFSFVITGTDKPLTLDYVYMTFFDLDNGPKHKARESVTVHGVDSIIAARRHEFNLAQNACTMHAISTENGYVCDDPEDAEVLHRHKCPGSSKSVDRKRRAVMVGLRRVSSFHVTLAVSVGHGHGRAFMFAGESSALSEEPTRFCKTKIKPKREQLQLELAGQALPIWIVILVGVIVGAVCSFLVFFAFCRKREVGGDEDETARLLQVESGLSDEERRERRQRAANSALARAEQAQGRGVGDSAAVQRMQARAERDELLGRIHARYASQGKEEPRNLGTATMQELQDLLR